jgi:thymidylate kinase
MQRNGQFIMVDGMTGSGKSTVLNAVQAWTEEQGHRVFRLSDWTDHEPPQFEKLSDYDVFFTYEPTRTWTGRAIRYELSRADNPYGGEELAHAFALDRQIMYKRLVIPALKAGKIVIQDRGISSSLVYQPVMHDAVTEEFIMNLPGNKLALEHAPDHLILTSVCAHEAHRRIHARDDESKGVFAQLEFLLKQEERFAADWLHSIFKKHGSRVYQLDTGGTVDDSRTRATELISQIFSR